MRSPMLLFLTSFIIFIVVISFGIFGGSILLEMAPDPMDNIKGRVLGVSEEIIDDNQLNINNLTKKLINELKNISNPENSVAENIKLPESEVKEIEKEIEPYSLDAGCGSVIDIKNNKILFSKDDGKEWPIASITKLITALVFLDHNPGWDAIYQIKSDDRRDGGKIYLYTGEKVTIKDLFYLSLVGSANTATMGLVHSTGMSEKEFVKKMNEKTKELGLEKTRLYDPAGLNSYNISTAKEIVKFAKIALENKYISEATLTRKYEFTTLNGENKVVYSTDTLLENFPENGINILGGKTGFLNLAGYCFVGKFIDHDGNEVISVVLGSDNRKSRFRETKELVEWAYENYIW